MESKEVKQITTQKSQIEKLLITLDRCTDDTPITFEYVLMCLFPTVWNNIQKALKDAYTNGYLQAKQEFEKN
jgi:hypothetical protein